MISRQSNRRHHRDFLVVDRHSDFVDHATFDWNRLQTDHQPESLYQVNRPFAIRGDLGVVWERQNKETGWRSWVPWPHVHAEDVILGNPPDIPESYDGASACHAR